MHRDYLIVGQGLAGTVLHEHIEQAGKSAIVLDNPGLSNSSKVAGGLYNPITGRKMVKTWNCDKLFSYLIPFYRSLQEKLGVEFFNEVPIYRPFHSVEELNEWMGKSVEPIYDGYVKEIRSSAYKGASLHDEFGGIVLDQCGYVNTNRLVSAYSDYLKSKDSIRNIDFDWGKLQINEEGVRYEEITANRLILCDGKYTSSSPYFNWLPFRLVKGEILWIKISESIKEIVNRGVFILPEIDGLCKVGATYDHENPDETPTIRGKNELIQKLRSLVNFDFEVVDQQAGVRPATKDRRPFIGIHPKHPQLAIFNGLGAKGVSLAPFYANQLLQHLNTDHELDSEVNINRFFSLL